MTHPGKKQAEGIKRLIRQAIEAAGMHVHELHMNQVNHIHGRYIVAALLPRVGRTIGRL